MSIPVLHNIMDNSLGGIGRPSMGAMRRTMGAILFPAALLGEGTVPPRAKSAIYTAYSSHPPWVWHGGISRRPQPTSLTRGSDMPVHM